MSFAKSKINEVTVLIPYGNPTGLLHFAFANDYKTFCGRTCEGWNESEETVARTMESAYCCKRCLKAFLK